MPSYLAPTLSHANASRVRARLVSGGLHRDWGSDFSVPFFPFLLTPTIVAVILHLFSVPSLCFIFTTLFYGWFDVWDEYEGKNGART